MAIQRQLTYYIPLEIMSRVTLIQTMLAKEAININGKCQITFQSLHTAPEVMSELVLTLVTTIENCNYIHRAMKKAIVVILKMYSPSTQNIHVTDEPIVVRDFDVNEEIL